MNRATEGASPDTSNYLRQQTLDIFIKECNHCAETCRTWAETYVGGAKKFAAAIDACLECARTCEIVARSLLLQKQGVRNIPQLQIEACVVSCRACARRCKEQANEFEGLSVCAEAARRCEEMIRTLLRPKVYHLSKSKIVTFLRSVTGI